MYKRQIHYTTDGKEPDLQSALYSEPLRLTTSKTVKAATFANGEQIGKTLDVYKRQVRWIMLSMLM